GGAGAPCPPCPVDAGPLVAQAAARALYSAPGRGAPAGLRAGAGRGRGAGSAELLRLPPARLEPDAAHGSGAQPPGRRQPLLPARPLAASPGGCRSADGRLGLAGARPLLAAPPPPRRR